MASKSIFIHLFRKIKCRKKFKMKSLLISIHVQTHRPTNSFSLKQSIVKSLCIYKTWMVRRSHSATMKRSKKRFVSTNELVHRLAVFDLMMAEKIETAIKNGIKTNGQRYKLLKNYELVFGISLYHGICASMPLMLTGCGTKEK